MRRMWSVILLLFIFGCTAQLDTAKSDAQTALTATNSGIAMLQTEVTQLKAEASTQPSNSVITNALQTTSDALAKGQALSASLTTKVNDVTTAVSTLQSGIAKITEISNVSSAASAIPGLGTYAGIAGTIIGAGLSAYLGMKAKSSASEASAQTATANTYLNTLGDVISAASSVIGPTSHAQLTAAMPSDSAQIVTAVTGNLGLPVTSDVPAPAKKM